MEGDPIALQLPPDGVPYGDVVDDVVPFNCLARAWKAAKFLGPDSTALAANTMPCPQ